MEIIRSTEVVADKILMNKQELLALDKRRQDNRQAIRCLENDGKDGKEGKEDAEAVEDRKPVKERKVWITIGSLLVKMEKEKALKLLKKGKELPQRMHELMWISFPHAIILLAFNSIFSIFLRKSFFSNSLFPVFFFSSNFLDQMQIEKEIQILRSDQKVLVNQQRDLEYLSPYSGSNLKSLDPKEINALKSSFPML